MDIYVGDTILEVSVRSEHNAPWCVYAAVDLQTMTLVSRTRLVFEWPDVLAVAHSLCAGSNIAWVPVFAITVVHRKYVLAVPAHANVYPVAHRM